MFLDADILFSAAYSPASRIIELWSLTNVRLLTSEYALAEARRNLPEQEQVERLTELMDAMDIVDPEREPLPGGTELPEKDEPILQAAIGAAATHLITGDVRHFGALFGQTVAGVRIITAAEYLLTR